MMAATVYACAIACTTTVSRVITALHTVQQVEDDHAEAPVWTRARLAELCDLPEEQVVEWALAMGNDYTRDVSLKMLNVPKSARSRPAEVRKAGPSWGWGSSLYLTGTSSQSLVMISHCRC